jgi:hypothetical protein
MSQLLLQVVIVVAFGAFCFGCGALVGWILARPNDQARSCAIQPK